MPAPSSATRRRSPASRSAFRDYWDVRGERPADKVGTTGYRALHLIVAKPDPEAGDRLMEVQLRTQYQHLWAEDVERTGERLGFALQGRRRSA